MSRKVVTINGNACVRRIVWLAEYIDEQGILTREEFETYEQAEEEVARRYLGRGRFDELFHHVWKEIRIP